MTTRTLSPSLSLPYISGLTHSPLSKSLDAEDLEEGDEFSLLADPTNRFDQYAVKVIAKGEQLGWIPKGQTEDISRLLLEGKPLVAVLTEHNLSQNLSRRIRVSIHTVSFTE